MIVNCDVVFAVVVRGWLTRRMAQKRHAAATVLQRHYRRHRLQRSTHTAAHDIAVENLIHSSAATSDNTATDTRKISADMNKTHPYIMSDDTDGVTSDDVAATPQLVSTVTGFKTVSAAVRAAFTVNSRFHLAGAFIGIPYLEAADGVLSRRRMPRVGHDLELLIPHLFVKCTQHPHSTCTKSLLCGYLVFIRNVLYFSFWHCKLYLF